MTVQVIPLPCLGDGAQPCGSNEQAVRRLGGRRYVIARYCQGFAALVLVGESFAYPDATQIRDRWGAGSYQIRHVASGRETWLLIR